MRIQRAALAIVFAVTVALAAPKPDYNEAARNFWSFQKPVRVETPSFSTASDQAWVRTPIDAFVLKKLRGADLATAAPASREALIRRAYFDVIGLPPTPAEVADFAADQSPEAWTKVVDRLLASKHFGERWGQHWLDLVRYAETEGFEYDRYLPGLWRFRDYVIDSFNDDKPFDQFIREQLAGDELAEGDPLEARNQPLHIAAGFHRLGSVRRNAGNQEVASSRNEILTERTDIVGAAFLGLTVGCARCHDHRFDPIKQRDYYQLQAFVAATQESDIPLEEDGLTPADWRAKTKELRGKLKKLRGEVKLADPAEQVKIREEYAKLEAQLPEPPATLSSTKNDYENRTVIHRLNRGEFSNKAERLDMRALGILLPEGAATTPADSENPRTILAYWLSKPDHPLTARVAVNRIWSHYFGQGIVNTPNDFGNMGGRPTHPELLDWLATEFVDSGWRMKAMHRLVLMSSAYQQASKNPSYRDRGMEKDADNRLLWHGPSRRLGAEELRDAMLSVAGKLNPAFGGRSVIIPVEDELVDALYDPTQWQVTADPAQHNRRSVYLIAKRNLRLPFMEVFDQPSAQTTCSRRQSSTHAPQSLELLNGRISNELAGHFAARIEREAGQDQQLQVERAYLLAVGRMPTEQETKLGIGFLEAQPLREFALAVFNLNSFLYLN